MFYLCRKLDEHFPVCDLFRVAAGFIKRRAKAIFCDWDEELIAAPLKMMLQKTIAKVNDPVKGGWCATDKEMNFRLGCHWKKKQ